MRTFRRALLAGLAGVLTVQAAQAAPAPFKTVTRVYGTDRCILTAQSADGGKFITAVLAFLVPKLIEFGIDALVEDLKKPKSVSSSGSLDDYLFELKMDKGDHDTLTPRKYPAMRMPGCLTIVTGGEGLSTSKTVSWPQASDGSAGEMRLDRLAAAAPASDVAARLQAFGIHAEADKIRSVFELRVEPSADGSAFRYVPAYYQAYSLLPGQGNGAQGVVYAISMLAAGPTPNGKSIASATINLGDVSAAKPVDISGKSTGWMETPGMTPAAHRAYMQRMSALRAIEQGGGAAGTVAYSPGDSTMLEITRPGGKPAETFSRLFMPYVFKVELTQTKDPSEAAKFAAKMLAAGRDKITGAVTGAMTKEDDDPFTVQQSLLDADIAVATAEAALATAMALPASDSSRDAKIRLAQLQLDRAKNERDHLN